MSPDPALAPGVVSRVAAVGRALANPRRVRVLAAVRHRPATVSEIAEGVGLSPAQASLQLSHLRRLGLVRVQRRGRHRIYSGDGDLLGRLLDDVGRLSPFPPAETGGAGRSGPSARTPRDRLRRARTCYDHLAGVAGVELAARLLAAGWVVASHQDFLVTRRGEEQLAIRGVDVDALRLARRRLAPGCLDWTERRPHLGGALGAALLRALRSQGYLVTGGHRRVHVRRPIEQWVGNPPAGVVRPRSGQNEYRAPHGRPGVGR